MKKKLGLSFIALTWFTASFSQITVDNTQTPQELVENVLLGGGVSASNITYNGSAVDAQSTQSNVTFFSAGTNNFPIATGILLTTGEGTVAQGPNDQGGASQSGTPSVSSDPDLNAIATNTVENGVVLEFDFVAGGDSVSFKYLFGSEEYPEFSPSSYNDAFGFFLSGPGITGPYSNNSINLAILPTTSTATDVVTINNVNPTTNPSYYVSNDAGAAYGTSIQYDGTTVVLTSTATIQCGQTYHIKLCIANVGDQGLDSGVFLEAESFSANGVEISMPPTFQDGAIYENCQGDADTITVVRPSNQIDETMTIQLITSGTATNGIDYSAIPDSITFEIGEDTLYIPLIITNDGLSESIESIILSSIFVNSCGDTIMESDTIYIMDPAEIVLNSMDTTIYCHGDDFPVSVVATEGVEPYSYSWDNGGVDDTTLVNGSPTSTMQYIVQVTDVCGNVNSDTVTVNYEPILAVISATPTSASPPAAITFGNFSLNATNYEWDFANGQTASVTNTNTLNSTYTVSGIYTITMIAFNGVCSDTATVEIELVDKPVIVTTPNVFTPNGDPSNNVFFIDTKHVENLHLTIIDRWGGLIFEEESPNPEWNGTTLSDNEAPDGVYFYTYIATGVNGEQLSGHGFITLIR
jgi:gliding motility-associated-like protein